MLNCKDTEIERNTLWEWFVDKLPVEVSSVLYLMEDEQLLVTLFGDILPVIDNDNRFKDHKDEFQLTVARYISKIYRRFFF